MKKDKMYKILAHNIIAGIVSGIAIAGIERLINKNKYKENISKKPEKEDEKTVYDTLAHAIQNIDDDYMIMPKSNNIEYKDNEYSIVKLYKQGRLFAKNIERETLIKNYAKEITLIDIDSKNKYTSQKAINSFYSERPKVIMRNLTYCHSCHKMFDDLKDYDFEDADFEFIIFIGKEDAKENTIDYVPYNLRDKVIITNKKDTLNLGLKRFPTTVFLTKDNRLFDIGGLVSIKAIEQRLQDIPVFPEDYSIEDEL